MTKHKTATREQWLTSQMEVLKAEKELTRLSDELARRRRELPWVRVDKKYRFDTEEGSTTLEDLFKGRSQLIVYHFMFGPGYTAGCLACSATADSFNGVLPHLEARDNLPPIVAQNASASGTDLAGYFSEGHGVSVFVREGDSVYHCYSSYNRGMEFLMGYYAILDRMPKGRDEGGPMGTWLRRHDEYGKSTSKDCCV